jgi:hypothetical protein
MYSIERDIAQESPKLLIAHNQYYELFYAPHKNRLYLSIFGFWKNADLVPDYVADLTKAQALLQPAFTLLLDLRTMITHPPAIMGLHVEILELLQIAGLKKCACVDPSDRIATLQIEDTLVQSHLPSERFSTYLEAEAWLEQE